jgi:hypothetical protein
MDLARRLAAISLTCLCFAPPAAAHPAGPNASYTLTVQDERGRELPTFHHQGQTFVLGTYGERYTIRVENRTGRRVEAVVSVDGRDVVSGHVGDYVRERGYLIDPYDRLVIEGFRQSWEQVAAFRFTSPGGSYSARMGTPQNVGVIGVAIFPERTYDVARPKMAAPRAPRAQRDELKGRGLGTRRSADASSAPSAGAYDDAPARREARESEGAPAPSLAPSASTDNLGTEYGESMSSSVQQVEFRRANAAHPAALITLRYDDRAGLLSRGIALEPPRPPRRRCGPEAFPSSRFAPAPPPYCD